MADEESSPAPVTAVATRPWFRGPAVLAALALILAGVIVVVVISIVGHNRGKEALPDLRMPDGRSQTLQDYLSGSSITARSVRRGEPGAPQITLGLPPNWADSGPDTPAWAYGEAFMKDSTDLNDPAVVDVLLSKVSGDFDHQLILEYAPGELRNLPGYQSVSPAERSTLSGFEAVQLGGLYTRDGQERIIAQKTVVIPVGDETYVLQINADASKADAPELHYATGVMDEKAEIVP